MTYDSEYPLEKIRNEKKLIFLAGSIDLQLLGNWRGYVSEQLKGDFDFFDPTTLNHGTLGESDWKKHIQWELQAMEMADIILLNFLPDALSPISLIELGLNIRGQKLIVICPNKFYKSQYIEVLCHQYSTPLFKGMNDAIAFISRN